MKITSNVSPNVGNVEQTKSDRLKELGNKKDRIFSSETDAPARLDFSERAQQIKKAKELATPDMSVDEEKVARLQKMIDEGNYKVDAEAIADSLVDEHLLMP